MTNLIRDAIERLGPRSETELASPAAAATSSQQLAAAAQKPAAPAQRKKAMPQPQLPAKKQTKKQYNIEKILDHKFDDKGVERVRVRRGWLPIVWTQLISR